MKTALLSLAESRNQVTLHKVAFCQFFWLVCGVYGVFRIWVLASKMSKSQKHNRCLFKWSKNNLSMFYSLNWGNKKRENRRIVQNHFSRRFEGFTSQIRSYLVVDFLHDANPSMGHGSKIEINEQGKSVIRLFLRILPHYKFESVRYSDSVKKHWITVNSSLKKFIGAMLTEIHWIFTESQKPSLIQI